MCLYQVGKHQAAASAAFTNLAVNPEVSSILNRARCTRAFYPGGGDAGESQLLPGSTLRC